MTEITSPRPNNCCASDEADERPGRVVVEEAGVEDSGDVKANVLRDHAKGSQFALRRCHQHHRADGRADLVGHVFAQNDGRHGGYALLHAGEIVGRFGLCRCGADTPVRRR